MQHVTCYTITMFAVNVSDQIPRRLSIPQNLAVIYWGVAGNLIWVIIIIIISVY